MKKQNTLPSAVSLYGTAHFPKIDNQGAIGSCASQAITRNQFSNAVSRYLHSKETGCKVAPRDNLSECFAPKFTFGFSGAGTTWVYDVISENGALSQTDCPFEKTEQGASVFKDKDGKLYTATTAWPVKESEMERAMQYRLSGYKQIWFTKDPYNEKLTTSEAGKELINMIKESLVRGDAVVTGGYPGRWVFGKVDGCGTYGKVGDGVIVAAAGNGSGGHQVTLVGYDDDITATFAGVRMKGAFLIANSYGEGWQNGGLTWLMYDACNTVSEFPQLNDSALYSGPMYLTAQSDMTMFPPSLATKPQTLAFEPAGECDLYGKTYPCFTAQDECGKYLAYSSEKGARDLTLAEETGGRFAFIPYADIMAFEASDKQWYKEEYEGSYWVYAPERDPEKNGSGMLDAGLAFAASGRKVNFATLNGGRYPEAKSWLLDCVPEGAFTSRLAIAAGKGVASERGWVLDQFVFLNHQKDIVVGMPKMYVKLTVKATDRECYAVYLTRKPKEGGLTKKVKPAIYRYQEFHPTYCDRKKGEYLNFDGVLGGGEATGYFAFNYEPLMKLPKDKTVTDYIWGIELKKGRKGKVSLVEATLCGSNKETLAEGVLNGNTATFEI